MNTLNSLVALLTLISLAQPCVAREALGFTTMSNFALCKGKPLKAEDYAVNEVFQGTPAKLDLVSLAGAKLFKTTLHKGYEGEANFAGHFRIIAWGCGTECKEFVLVDLKTGRVMPGGKADIALTHSAKSSLLVVNSLESLLDFYGSKEEISSAKTTRYYQWNSKLTPLCEVKY
jgi:hypothetical protein